MSGYFRVTQKQSGGGSGATITVSYDSSFYSKTITCSDGTTTYTATTTSSGSTTFNVNAEGTWTITCDGTSKTVEVVLNYATQLSTTKTITVYSAASDTVSFTDMAGSKTVTTDSDGVGSVSITFVPGQSITFTSSVAKDPSNLNNYYSRQVTMSSSTTQVMIMPNGGDGVLYWYGYKGSELEDCTSANGWTASNYNGVAPTYNTNKAVLSSSSGQFSGMAAKNAHTVTVAKAIAQGKTPYSTNYYVSITKATRKASFDSQDEYWERTNSLATIQTVNNPRADCYSKVSVFAGGSADVYAFWYE